jgi:hypothetical protein
MTNEEPQVAGAKCVMPKNGSDMNLLPNGRRPRFVKVWSGPLSVLYYFLILRNRDDADKERNPYFY